jgi:hypothetical protein
MTVELANLFLSSNTSHAWLTTRVRMLRNKTPCRVAQWLNEIPIPALKLQSQLLRKESSLEYFYTADHQECMGCPARAATRREWDACFRLGFPLWPHS